MLGRQEPRELRAHVAPESLAKEQLVLAFAAVRMALRIAVHLRPCGAVGLREPMHLALAQAPV